MMKRPTIYGFRSMYTYLWGRTEKACAVLFLMVLSVQFALAQQQTIPVYDKTGGLGCVVVVDSIRLSKGDLGRTKTASPDTLVGLTFTVGLAENALSKTDQITVVPRLFTATDSLDFPPMRLFGSWAYVALLRGNGAAGLIDYPASEARMAKPYSQHVNYKPWMDQAQLKLLVSQADGCGSEYLQNARVIGERHMLLNQREVLKKTTTQVSQLEGRAYINFVVNKTDIRPELGKNRQELGKLHSILDSLRRVAKMQIRQIFLKGYASPEGSYQHNDELSKGRVESLRQYLIDHYQVEGSLISTDNEPEDWEGLRDYVSKSDLADREQILAIIDTNDDPDKKLALIVKNHAEAYKHLLKVVFPLLRHTDYRIDYTLTKGEETEYKEMAVDTSYINSVTFFEESLLPPLSNSPKTFRPIVAVKTNLLYDLLVAPNIELEVPFGRNKRWSLMAEYTNPWWRWKKLDYSYEIQEGGLELRHWNTPRCDGSRPWLSGSFLGVYAAALKYDLENDGTGDQGELYSAGLTYGYSWPIGTRWNLELSASAGAAFGERRHYRAEFESTHLIYRYTKNMFYVGPTKLKISLVYLLGKKGGAK